MIDRIGCTMCHGVHPDDKPSSTMPGHTWLTRSVFERKTKMMAEAGVVSMSYDELEAWRAGQPLGDKRLLIDFDHAVRTIWTNAQPIFEEYGLAGNLFINTDTIEAESANPPQDDDEREYMTWDQVGRLVEKGWQIGSHTVNHPSLAELEAKDPTGGLILEELAGADETIKQRLGITAKDLAYTGLGWSGLAEEIAKQRYRFARLWITGRMYLDPAGNEVSVSSLMGLDGPDEADGGPPFESRYITEQTNFYRIPSMELEYLLSSDEAFEHYLGGLSVQGKSGL